MIYEGNIYGEEFIFTDEQGFLALDLFIDFHKIAGLKELDIKAWREGDESLKHNWTYTQYF